MYTLNQLLAIADFLGDEMSDNQVEQLMDEARQLSISEREILLDKLPGGAFYTEMSMHDAEMGGLSRW